MILLSGPNLSGNELKYVTDCIKTGWVSSVGSYVSDLKEAYQSILAQSISNINGTTALHLSIITLM